MRSSIVLPDLDMRQADLSVFVVIKSVCGLLMMELDERGKESIAPIRISSTL